MNAKQGRHLTYDEALAFAEELVEIGLTGVKLTKQNQGWMWAWNCSETVNAEDIQKLLEAYEKKCGVYN